MTWHVTGIRLPDGDTVEESWLGVRGWQRQPVSKAEELPGRFVLSGFVDAHAHVSFAWRDGPVALDRRAAEANLDRHAMDGVAVLRDLGGDPAVVLGLPSIPGRPFLIPAGRHLAPPGMYFEAVHLPVERQDLVNVALGELGAGARWVKLVADFAPSRARDASSVDPPIQTYDLEVVRDLVAATHRAGGRVAAHVTTAIASDLVQIGIDSVEHGTALETTAIAEMASRGTGWTPTLCAQLSRPDDGSPERRRVVSERRQRFSELLPIAARLGVPIMTGTDVAGTITEEVALMVECGLTPVEALRAATTTPLDFLGSDATEAPPSVVTYDEDPRNAPEVLARPRAIIVGGRRVR